MLLRSARINMLT
ncbi:unnamed protein product, partial [Didymodactylos carnosus]